MFQDTVVELMKSVDLKNLEYLAAVRVGISVCETEDMQYMMGRFRRANNKDGFSDRQWRPLRRIARRKLKQLGVFDIIIDIILKNLWPICFEIFKWILYHVEHTGIDYSPKFFWTPQVSINYEKTAEIWIKNEELDINKRFKLACLYCLDSEVRSLWEKMGLSEKRSFFVRGNLQTWKLNPIVRYWTYYIQEVPIDYWGSKTLDHKELFLYAIDKGYLSATKYFFRNLKESQRKQMINNGFYRYFGKVYNAEYIVKDQLAIACFLTWQLPSNHWQDTLPYLCNLNFYYFLEWPLQKHFMTAVNRLRHYLKETTFTQLLERIFSKVIGRLKDFDYKELFMEFWYQSPDNIKTIVRTETVGYKIFMKFVKRYFEFVFEENSFALKAQFRAIVFQQDISENITHFEKENVDFFKFLVRESVTTKSCIQRFTNPLLENFPFNECSEFFVMPLGELMYLIDGILGNM